MYPNAVSLEYSRDQMRAMADAVTTRCIEHIASLPQQPIRGDVEGAVALCRALRESAPEQGSALEPLLDLVFDECVPRTFNAASGGYLAFIPGGGLYPVALADFIADAVNRTAGGSMATFNAILCARERHLGADIRRGVLYTSDQAHHCVLKSAKLAGIMPDRVRGIPCDAQYRLPIDALRAAITADRAAGLLPFAVVTTAGTTNTGAVDRLDVVADLCAEQGLWHHIDGAYGAFFHLDPTLRAMLSGLSRADSLTLDPHKGMFLPYGTGALLVRDGAALRTAHEATADYLPAMPHPEDFYDPSQHGPDLSRGFPGLRVWLCVKLYGAAAFRQAIVEKRQLALDAYERIRVLPGIVIDAPPDLSLFAFHVSWPGATLAEEDAATRALMTRVTAGGRVMVTGAVARGRYLGRVCVLSFRTHAAEIEMLMDDLGTALAEIVPSAA
jgi:aromatic-L-amino-acid decarboxylase